MRGLEGEKGKTGKEERKGKRRKRDKEKKGKGYKGESYVPKRYFWVFFSILPTAPVYFNSPVTSPFRS